MDENEFELDGVVYVAKRGEGCDGCSFDASVSELACGSYLPQCIGSDRIDGIDVIFVEKQQ